MYIVRVDYKNGQHLEFMFTANDGLGRAERCRELLVTAQKLGLEGKPTLCEPWDDAGRQSSLSGVDIQSVQLVDVGREAAGAVNLKLLCEAVARQLDPGAFQPPPRVRDSDRMTQDAGAIGGGGQRFSS